jgi:hypothetical protein
MKLAKEGEETIGSHRMEDDVVEKKGCYQLGRGKTGEVSAAVAAVANQFSRGSHCPRPLGAIGLKEEVLSGNITSPCGG